MMEKELYKTYYFDPADYDERGRRKSDGKSFPFLTYGMDLTQGKSFDAVQDPFVNHEMEKYSPSVYVYGIDSAFMTEFDEYGYPILDENSDIYPLTLLVDSSMRNNEVRLAVPTMDDGDETEDVTINVPQFEYA